MLTNGFRLGIEAAFTQHSVPMLINGNNGGAAGAVIGADNKWAA
jgi:hypothetical protein